MDLYGYLKFAEVKNNEPLASRMRPKTLDEIIGQKHIIGKGESFYNRAIKSR